MRAVSNGQKESVLLLLENGANPNVTNDVSIMYMNYVFMW